jgi:hypothetical protein
MSMRFYVERNVLADDTGKILPITDPTRVSYVVVDVSDVETAVRSVADGDAAEFLFPIHRMSPEQATATVRRGRRVFTLHAFPEEEARDRILRT